LWRYVEANRKDNDKATVRGMLIAPHVADKARALLRDHKLEWKELAWEEILPQVERMRRTGQVGLGRF
jgi:RecB family endonuclease NucS